MAADVTIKNLSVKIPVGTWVALRKAALDSGLDFQDYLRAMLATAPRVHHPKTAKSVDTLSPAGR